MILVDRKIKVCANCRYLKLLEKGYEFDHLLDSEYLVFQCTIRDWTVREDYLMKSFPEEIEEKDTFTVKCPFWEEWKAEEEKTSNTEDFFFDDSLNK